jgi:hypothetical protein
MLIELLTQFGFGAHSDQTVIGAGRRSSTVQSETLVLPSIETDKGRDPCAMLRTGRRDLRYAPTNLRAPCEQKSFSPASLVQQLLAADRLASLPLCIRAIDAQEYDQHCEAHHAGADDPRIGCVHAHFLVPWDASFTPLAATPARATFSASAALCGEGRDCGIGFLGCDDALELFIGWPFSSAGIA